MKIGYIDSSNASRGTVIRPTFNLLANTTYKSGTGQKSNQIYIN